MGWGDGRGNGVALGHFLLSNLFKLINKYAFVFAKTYDDGI